MNRLYTFLIGRNGLDKLNLFLCAVYVLIAVINTFARNTVLFIILWVLFLIILFRTLSKNIHARSKENAVYLKLRTSVLKITKYPFMKIKDIKRYRYRKCKFCKATVRLPIKKGRHGVKCPACGFKFKVFIAF